MAFSVTAFFGGDTSGLKTATTQAEGIISDWSHKTKDLLGEVGAGFLASFSVFSAAGKFVEGIGEIQAQLKELRNLSKEFEISTSSIQAWQATVIKGGGAAEDAIKGFNKLRLAIDQLESGSQAQTKAFEKLGLSAQDFIDVPIDEAMYKVAKAFEENKEKAGAYAALAEILGARTLPQLNLALKFLAENGVQGMIDKQKEANKVWNEDAVAALGNIGSAGKQVFNFIASSALKIGYDLYAAFKLPINAMGALAAAAADSFDGIKTDSNDFIDGLLTGLEKVTVAERKSAEAAGEMAEKTRAAVAEFLNLYDAALKKASEGEKGEEKLTALMLERNELIKEMVSGLGSEVEQAARFARLGQINTEYQTEQLKLNEASGAEMKKTAQEQEKAAKAQEESNDRITRQLLARNQTLDEQIKKIKFEALPADERIAALTEQRNKLESEMNGITKDSIKWKEDFLKLHELDVNLSAEQLKVDKQITAEMKAQSDQIDANIRKQNALQSMTLGARGGAQLENQSDSVLTETSSRNASQIADLKRTNTFSIESGPLGNNAYEIARLETENANINAILSERSRELNIYKTQGYDAALRSFNGNPAQFDSFLSVITKSNNDSAALLKANTTELQKIGNTLTQTFGGK